MHFIPLLSTTHFVLYYGFLSMLASSVRLQFLEGKYCVLILFAPLPISFQLNTWHTVEARYTLFWMKEGINHQKFLWWYYYSLFFHISLSNSLEIKHLLKQFRQPYLWNCWYDVILKKVWGFQAIWKVVCLLCYFHKQKKKKKIVLILESHILMISILSFLIGGTVK